MQSYYQQLSSGAGRSQALRYVQLEMMQTTDHAHPYFWASFTFSGNWSPMPGEL
jgi:CHAT domain-containing protein